MRGKTGLVAVGCAALLALTATSAAADPSSSDRHDRNGPLVVGRFSHLVVIYQENHSFDNLYGTWGSVNGEHVEGLADAQQVNTTQVAQNGDAYGCLLQNDVNLSSPTPLPSTCKDKAHGVAASAFANEPFSIDKYIKPTDKTCPPHGGALNVLKDSPGALPGGCTRDLVHRFYQEQYQLNGGLQNRYLTGSDAVGLTMGTYDTTQAAHLQVPARPERAGLRDRRPLLPGGFRRVVLESSVPGVGAGTHRYVRRDGPHWCCIRSSTRTGSRTRPIRSTRSTRRPR